MSLLSLWDVEFEVVRKGAGGQGPVYTYRRGIRRTTVSSATQAGILAVLQADIPIQSGEVIEIISIRPGAVVGTEDGQALA